MAIYHKINYLDIRKIKHYQSTYKELSAHFFPEHLFLLSALYPIEVAYDNYKCSMRLLCAKDQWFQLPDFYLNKTILQDAFIFQDFTYSTKDFMGKSFKRLESKNKKLLKKTNLYFQRLKKEDFSLVVLFMQLYYEERSLLNEPCYFQKLVYLKFAFEHLYELGLEAIAVVEQDEIKGLLLSMAAQRQLVVETLLCLKEYEPILLNYLLTEVQKKKSTLVTFESLQTLFLGLKS